MIRHYSLLFIIVCSLWLTNAKAQLISEYSVSPDWTVTTLDTAEFHLYSMLDSGYAVFIDLSATWCGPCWSIHQNGLLQQLHDKHGPNGTNTLRVLYIESESANSTAQLYGTGTSGGGANRATDTQGDWVGTHTYPFADNSSVANLYGLSAYPTLIFIGTDRLVRPSVGSPGPSVERVEQYMSEDGGQSVGSTDIRLLPITDELFAYCTDATASLRIQNHGSDTIESVSLLLTNQDFEVLDTFTVNRRLLPYQANLDLFDFQLDGSASYYLISINEADSFPHNDTTNFSVTNLDTGLTDAMFDFEGSNPSDLLTLPDNLHNPDGLSDFPALILNKNALSNPPSQDLGGYGESVFSLLFDFYEFSTGSSTVVMDRSDLTTYESDKLKLVYDYAYAQYENENDGLRIQLSMDCGRTWRTLYSNSGAGLATAPPTQSFFLPQANQWATNEINLSAFANQTNVIIKFVGTTGYGNNLYLDNIRIESSSATREVASIRDINVYPNPASDYIITSINAEQTADVVLNLIDMTGRQLQSQRVNLISGSNEIMTHVDRIEPGSYMLQIIHGDETMAKPVQIFK